MEKPVYICVIRIFRVITFEKQEFSTFAKKWVFWAKLSLFNKSAFKRSPNLSSNARYPWNINTVDKNNFGEFAKKT